ncbi:MAG: hypothetical protein MRK02_15015 [Candidatus Scalindua sp.]|nr:hypothetical protein [Candidatus Scalindua sp.]
MTHAYTPGLRLSEKTLIRKKRLLPLSGEVMVKNGATVNSEDVVARTNLPGKVLSLNVVNRLGILPKDIHSFMLKGEGEDVQKDEPLAETKPLIKFFKSVCFSPITGKIETVSDVTGQVLLRYPPRPVQINAYVDGKVVEVFEKEGVVISAYATFIQGIFGIGGEATGELTVVAKTAKDVLKPSDVKEEHKGKIIVAGSIINYDVIQKSLELGIKGIIVGGIKDNDINQLLGYDLGAAITGSEDINITLIITEGFGQIDMAEKTFNVLTSRAGSKASISGATQIRAGVVRPEIIIPFSEEFDTSEVKMTEISPVEEESAGIAIDDLIRIIRTPYFGKIGKVKSLPSELRKIETEAVVRVLEVEFPDGQTAIIPRSNVEAIETG